MIAALALALAIGTAAGDEPRPPRSPSPPPRTEPAPDRKAQGKDVGPAPEDEEVVRNLELLEQLPLVEHLELYDASGDADPKAPPGR